MTNLDSFTLALRRASEAHPELRIGQLMAEAAHRQDRYRWGAWLEDASDADLTEALNRFAETGEKR